MTSFLLILTVFTVLCLKSLSLSSLNQAYYCNGRTIRLLAELGFTNVKHEKRDFYKDVRQHTVPFHDVFITNPPYSENHKQQCIQYALDKLRSKGTPFFILMPNYIASKEYYRTLIAQQNDKFEEDSTTIVYLVPPTPYEYDHPEGTGSEIPPFSSIWYCGMKQKYVTQAKDAATSAAASEEVFQRKVRFCTSIRDLVSIGAISNKKRDNPRQRRRKKQRVALKGTVSVGITTLYNEEKNELHSAQITRKRSRTSIDNVTGDSASRKDAPQSGDPKGGNNRETSTKKRNRKKKSRHRGPDGKRTKKRF